MKPVRTIIHRKDGKVQSVAYKNYNDEELDDMDNLTDFDMFIEAFSPLQQCKIFWNQMSGSEKAKFIEYIKESSPL